MCWVALVLVQIDVVGYYFVRVTWTVTQHVTAFQFKPAIGLFLPQRFRVSGVGVLGFQSFLCQQRS